LIAQPHTVTEDVTEDGWIQPSNTSSLKVSVLQAHIHMLEKTKNVKDKTEHTKFQVSLISPLETVPH
jgi:hypothetical protein